MKNVYVMISVLFLISVAHAGVLDLDESNIEDGFLTQDGVTYRILDDREFTIKYLENGFLKYRRIIVENFDEIRKLEKRIKEVFLAVDNLNYQIEDMKNQISRLEGDKTETLALLVSLEEERDKYKAELDELEVRKNELENTITGNFLLSPLTYQLGITVFIIILVATIIIKGREYLVKKEK